MKIDIDFSERPANSLGGFHVNWIEATRTNDNGTKTKLGIDAGAGCGSPLLTFRAKDEDGKWAWWDCDIREVMKILADRLAPEPKP